MVPYQPESHEAKVILGPNNSSETKTSHPVLLLVTFLGWRKSVRQKNTQHFLDLLIRCLEKVQNTPNGGLMAIYHGKRNAGGTIFCKRNLQGLS